MKSPVAKKSSSGARVIVSRAPVVSADAWKIDALGFLGLALLTGLAYLLGAEPLLTRHALIRNQQQDLLVARDKSMEVQRALGAAKLQLANAQRQVAASPLRLQPVTQLNQRLALVTELSTQGGAGLDDLQPGKSVSGSQYDALSLHVAGSGSFPAFAALLHRLREEFPDTGLSRLEISGNPQDPHDVARFNVDLLWFTEPLKSSGKNSVKPVNLSQNGTAK